MAVVGPQCPARPRLCPARDPPFAAALALAAFRHVHRHVRLMAPSASPASMLMAPCSGDVPLPRRRRPPARALSMAPNGEEEEEEGGGTYVDLGSLPFDDPLDGIAIALPSNELTPTDTPAEETLEEWRAQHWIVLVDDEPSIRLAIGDYLHSAGYCTVTACDGPLAFLELLLHSCAWSLTGEGEADGGTELAAGNGGGSGEGLDAPPWMAGADAKWRLPNCVISDIRMPGGIDGVQLLGLLRRVPGPPGDEKETEESRSKPKKKKRGRSKKEDTSSEYDAKDEYDLMDAIVSGGTSSATERIATPEDQAMKYLDAARECIECLCQRSSADGPEMDLPLPYPASLEQIPVVLLTAKAMVADRIAGYRAGANGYLPKPFRPEELLGIVDGLMRKQERERSAWRSARQNEGGADATGEGALDREFGDLAPEQAVDLTRDLVEVRKMLQAQVERRQAGKEMAERDRLRSLLPNALWMLKTGERRPRAFSKDHIRSILFFCYGAWFPKNNTTRKDVLEELERRMAEKPEKALGSQSS
ncbi:hypothetical protein ACHAXT_012874 [Thalassiosira profunda]